MNRDEPARTPDKILVSGNTDGSKLHIPDDDGDALCDKLERARSVYVKSISVYPPSHREGRWCRGCVRRQREALARADGSGRPSAFSGALDRAPDEHPMEGDEDEDGEILIADGAGVRFPEFDDDRYGYINEKPHVHIPLTYSEWHHGLQQALRHIGPPVAWKQDGDVWLWGDNLDEQTLYRLSDEVEEIESDYASDGMYDAAETCRRAATKIADAEVKPAEEAAIE